MAFKGSHCETCDAYPARSLRNRKQALIVQRPPRACDDLKSLLTSSAPAHHKLYHRMTGHQTC